MLGIVPSILKTQFLLLGNLMGLMNRTDHSKEGSLLTPMLPLSFPSTSPALAPVHCIHVSCRALKVQEAPEEIFPLALSRAPLIEVDAHWASMVQLIGQSFSDTPRDTGSATPHRFYVKTRSVGVLCLQSFLPYEIRARISQRDRPNAILHKGKYI